MERRKKWDNKACDGRGDGLLGSSSKEDILVYYTPFWDHDGGRLLPKRITRGEKQTEKGIGNVSGLTCEERSAEVYVSSLFV